MWSAKMNRFRRGNEITSVQKTTHAHTIDRFIKTFKDKLYRRLDSLNGNKTKWITHKGNLIKKRNVTQVSIALLKSSLMGLAKHKITFGLTGTFKHATNKCL